MKYKVIYFNHIDVVKEMIITASSEKEAEEQAVCSIDVRSIIHVLKVKKGAIK